jgi:AcrR family transcriptional regulator
VASAPRPAPRRRTAGRGVAEIGPHGEEAILKAAIAAMAEHGYHGTSVRDIAERAELSPAALYYHFTSKQDLLATIMERGIDRLLMRTRTALAEAGEAPADQLSAIVAVQVLFHLESQGATLLGTSEMRALEEPVRSKHRAKRLQQQRLFDQVIADGVARGVFTTTLPAEAARAIVVMCTGVASWFSPEGSLSREQVVQHYQRLTLDMVGGRDT